MNNNTEARDQIRAIPANDAELTLYRNQRAAVLVQDIVDLDTAVNDLLDPQYQTNNISLEQIKDKLDHTKFNLEDYVMPAEFTPNDLYTEGKELLTPTESYWGIRSITPPISVKLSEPYKCNLTQAGLTEESKEDLEGNIVNTKVLKISASELTNNGETFGVTEVEVNPILVSYTNVKNISKSDFEKSTEEETHTYTYNQTETVIPTADELGYNSIENTTAVTVKTRDFTAEELLNNIGKTVLLDTESDFIGFNSIKIPDFDQSVEIETPTISPITNTETNIINIPVVTEDPDRVFNIETVEGSTIEKNSSADKLGFVSVKNIPTTIGAYTAALNNTLSTNNIGTYDFSFDAETNTIKNSGSISNNEDTITIKSNDTKYALSAIKIPMQPSCDVIIGPNILNNLLTTNNSGKLLIGNKTVLDEAPSENTTKIQVDGLINTISISYPAIAKPVIAPTFVVVEHTNNSPELLIKGASDITDQSHVSNITEIASKEIDEANKTSVYSFNADTNVFVLYWKLSKSNIALNFTIKQYTNKLIDNQEYSVAKDFTIEYDPNADYASKLTADSQIYGSLTLQNGAIRIDGFNGTEFIPLIAGSKYVLPEFSMLDSAYFSATVS